MSASLLRSRALQAAVALGGVLGVSLLLPERAPTPAAAARPDARALLLQAEAAWAADRDLARTLDLLTRGRAAGPLSAEGLVRRAALAARAGDPCGAAADLDAAQRLGPASVEALLVRADLARGRGDADAAERALRQALAAGPRRAAPALGLARLTLGRGSADGARHWVEEALRREPGRAEVALAAAEVLLDAAAPALAEAALRGALDAPGPAAPVAAVRLASLLVEAARWAEAEALLRRALGALRPDDAHTEAVARATLARVLQRLGAPLAEVEPHARRAEALAPGAPDTRKALASLARARGDLDEAFGHLDAVARAAPRDVEAHEGLAWLHTRLGFGERALVHARRAVATRPDLPGPHVALSRAAREADRPDEALAAARRALERKDDATARAALAAALAAAGAPAAEVLAACPAGAVDEPEAALDLAHALAAAGEPGRARQALRRALARATASGPRERLAAAVAALGA